MGEGVVMLEKTTFEQVPLAVVQRVVREEIKRAEKTKEPRRAISEAKVPSMGNSSDVKEGKP